MSRLLVRAVVIRDGRLLAARSVGSPFAFLPGGHVEENEWLADALRRELEEEIGATVIVGRYLGFVEHEWVDGGSTIRELNHCFAATIPDGFEVRSREAHISFEWLRVDEMKAEDLRPPPLVGLLQSYVRGTRELWEEKEAEANQQADRMPRSAPREFGRQ